MVLETVRSKVAGQNLPGAFFMHHLRVEGISEGASSSCQTHSFKPFRVLTLSHAFGKSPGGLNTSLKDPSPALPKVNDRSRDDLAPSTCVLRMHTLTILRLY